MACHVRAHSFAKFFLIYLTFSRPVEIHQIHLKPSDFFTANPAIDVPGVKNNTSVLVDRTNGTNGTNGNHVSNGANGVNGSNASNGDSCCGNGSTQSAAESHLQGSGPDYDPNARS